MYRIMLATSGFYYVQQQNRYGWAKIGGWLPTKRDAMQLTKDFNKVYGDEVPFDGKVVCYA